MSVALHFPPSPSYGSHYCQQLFPLGEVLSVVITLSPHPLPSPPFELAYPDPLCFSLPPGNDGSQTWCRPFVMVCACLLIGRLLAGTASFKTLAWCQLRSLHSRSRRTPRHQVTPDFANCLPFFSFFCLFLSSCFAYVQQKCTVRWYKRKEKKSLCR